MSVLAEKHVKFSDSLIKIEIILKHVVTFKQVLSTTGFHG